jgi:hypothetical protein
VRNLCESERAARIEQTCTATVVKLRQTAEWQQSALALHWYSFGTSSGNFAPRFPEKNDETKRREAYRNISSGFFCVLIAHIRGFAAAVSDQARATICKHRP